jgi:hypothetical protein
MDRIFSKVRDNTQPAQTNILTSDITPAVPPPADTPEQRVDKYIAQSKQKYDDAAQQSKQEVAQNAEERTGNEDKANLGRLVGTLLGHVLTGGHSRNTAMVIPPTVAAASKGEELNKLLGAKDIEDHHIGLKSYMDTLLKGQDFYKSLEMERWKNENAGSKFSKQIIQDAEGGYHVVTTDTGTGETTHTPLGLQGKPPKDPNALTPGQGLAERRLNNQEERTRLNEIDKGNAAIEKIRTQMRPLDLAMRKLNSGDEAQKDETITEMENYDKKYVGLSHEQMINQLTKDLSDYESEIANHKRTMSEVDNRVKVNGDDYYTQLLAKKGKPDKANATEAKTKSGTKKYKYDPAQKKIVPAE